MELPDVFEDAPLPDSFEALFGGVTSGQSARPIIDVPVSVGRSAHPAPAPEYALPKPPPVRPPKWYGPNESVEVHGLRLPGLVRVATEQPDVGRQNSSAIALWLPVEFATSSDEPQPLQDSWAPPSYGALSSVQRGLYLRWLAADRSFNISPGFALLFLSGLESRLREVEPGALAKTERIAMAQAARSLVERYGSAAPRLQEYGLNFAGFLEAIGAPPNLYRQRPPAMPVSFDVPALLEVAIGQVALDGETIPADWALAFVRCDPRASRRTPVGRCPDEFADLFALRFAKDFPQGLKPRSRSGRPLNILYRCMPEWNGAGQTSLSAQVALASNAKLSEAQVAQLRDTAERCSEQLAAYSRFVGRRQVVQNTADAEVRLPVELLQHRLAAQLGTLVTAAGASKEVSTAQAWQVLWGRGPARKDSVPFLHALLKAIGLTVARQATNPSAGAVPNRGFRLDQSRLAQIRKDDAAATRLLATLFAESHDSHAQTNHPVEKVVSARTVLPGLDDDHFELLSEMLNGNGCTRESLQQTAQALDLMLDGALERINDAVVDVVGEVLVADDGELEIASGVVEALRAVLVETPPKVGLDPRAKLMGGA